MTVAARARLVDSVPITAEALAENVAWLLHRGVAVEEVARRHGYARRSSLARRLDRAGYSSVAKLIDPEV